MLFHVVSGEQADIWYSDNKHALKVAPGIKMTYSSPIGAKVIVRLLLKKL